jgi:S-adenosylmethionine synthetase
MSYLFTSESVSEGHPDKVADAISDGILDLVLRDGNNANRCACETLVTTDQVVLAGEYKGILHDAEVSSTVRRIIKNIGYEQEGFHWANVNILNFMHGQSADIALGTDTFGAGDQGLMFGYAINETPDLMPSAIYYSHQIVKELTLRRNNGVTWLGPDAKSQVTMEYHDDGSVSRIDKIVCSTQHSADIDIAEVRVAVESYIREVLPKELIDANTEFLINPTGRFVIGGPDGDTGLTGRKIIVDTYGGYSPHGGGAFSGKDPTKVDRSAAYMARYLAKNIVASGRATKATVQLSYAIGVKQPTSLFIKTDRGVDLDTTDWIEKNVDLTPAGIINRFELFRPIYSETTNYGHFGKANLPWEAVDLFKD